MVHIAPFIIMGVLEQGYLLALGPVAGRAVNIVGLDPVVERAAGCETVHSIVLARDTRDKTAAGIALLDNVAKAILVKFAGINQNLLELGIVSRNTCISPPNAISDPSMAGWSGTMSIPTCRRSI